MQLADFFTALSHGSLSNLSIGGEGSGSIPVEHENRLVTLTNQSLLALYSKFLLLEKELVIRALNGRTTYPFKKIHADSDPTILVDKFIADSEFYPFFEDVLRVLLVYDEAGNELPLNQKEDESSLFLPSPTELQIPKPVEGDAYYVLYQARHPKLEFGDLAQEIVLPQVLMPALECHVSYKVLAPMNGQEHTLKAVEQLELYGQICAEVEAKDLVGTSFVSPLDKLDTRGFR